MLALRTVTYCTENEETPYRCRAIELSLAVLDSRLDELTFLALLVREADFGGNLDVLDLARSFFDERLEYFLMEHGQGQCPEHKLILDRVLLSERQVKKKDMAYQHEAQDLSNLVPVPISVTDGHQVKVAKMLALTEAFVRET